MLQESIQEERLHNALILVVDDLETNRAMLIRSLNSRGYTKILHAQDGAQALQITHDLRPDLVILDLVMPGMDGFAYCQAIRNDPNFNNMPIIVQTVLDESENKLKAFYLGASDYICRPIDPDELSARAQVHITKKMLVEDLSNHNSRMKAEMESARAMQSRLMPDAKHITMCERIFELKIGSHFETCDTLGGDAWSIRPLSDQKLSLCLYDFSGHGVSAAMNIFRIHTVMQECMFASGDPGNFLTNINNHLYPLLDRDSFATMFYAIIDTAANCLLHASAACPAPLLFSPDGAEALSSRGFPLGIVSNAIYETKYAPFMPGDMLLTYSDCLIESKNSAGTYITEPMIIETIRNAMKDSMNPAKQGIDALVALLRRHSPYPLEDDLSINSYWRTPTQSK